MIAENNNLPQHVAFIMDGNRRWAEKNSLPISEGHKMGVKTIKEIIIYGKEKGINNLTFFLFSSENWQRKQEEVGFLMDLIFKSLSKTEYSFLDENKVRIKFIGSRGKISSAIQERMDDAQEHTAKYDGVNVTLAFNYGARQEITDAVRKIAQEISNKQLQVDDISEQVIAENMYSADLPEPDLLVRTSGEYRVSNFLLWQIAYSELYFTDTLWPDFDRVAFDQALDTYKNRVRRYGV